MFSRRVWSFPLKDKKANTILTKFKSIGKTPSLLWVDKGSEFYNTKMQQWNKTNDIKMYSTFGENKAVFIERFNRTLKTIMWKEFTRSQSYRWIDKLKDFIEQYNDKIH